jgi:hypothetical protein
MKTKVSVMKDVEIRTLEVNAGVRYWKDATVNGVEDVNGDLIPCRKGDMWNLLIDIDNGVIINWKQGVKADVHYKVCDAGSYYLRDDDGNAALSIEDDYVPSILCPTESGYGDYIIMSIDENGKIDGWKVDISSFTNDEND